MQGRVHEVQDFNGQIDLYCRGTSQRLFDDKDGPWQEMARDKCFTFRKRRAQSREWRGIVLLRFFNDNGTPVRIRIFPSMNDAAWVCHPGPLTWVFFYISQKRLKKHWPGRISEELYRVGKKTKMCYSKEVSLFIFSKNYMEMSIIIQKLFIKMQKVK